MFHSSRERVAKKDRNEEKGELLMKLRKDSAGEERRGV